MIVCVTVLQTGSLKLCPQALRSRRLFLISLQQHLQIIVYPPTRRYVVLQARSALAYPLTRMSVRIKTHPSTGQFARPVDPPNRTQANRPARPPAHPLQTRLSDGSPDNFKGQWFRYREVVPAKTGGFPLDDSIRGDGSVPSHPWLVRLLCRQHRDVNQDY